MFDFKPNRETPCHVASEMNVKSKKAQKFRLNVNFSKSNSTLSPRSNCCYLQVYVLHPPVLGAGRAWQRVLGLGGLPGNHLHHLLARSDRSGSSINLPLKNSGILKTNALQIEFNLRRGITYCSQRTIALHPGRG